MSRRANPAPAAARRDAARRLPGAASSRPGSTEALHPGSRSLDGAPTLAFVQALHAEDLRAVRAAGKVSRQVARVADAVAAALHAGGRLIYVGAGTSGRLGVLDAAECPPTFGTRPEQIVGVIAGGPKALARSVEGAEDDADDGARQMEKLGVSAADVVCGLSASARTPFVLGALRAARAAKATTALVSCNPALARKVRVDLHVTPDTGPELVSGSTRLKAGTATRLVLNAISTAAMARLGRVRQGRMVSMKATNHKLTERALRIIEELTGASRTEAERRLARAGGQLGRALALTALLLFAQACTCKPTSSCTPTTCEREGATCGSLSDACGGMLSCGECVAPQTCGGGGALNRCGCVPVRHCRQAVDCGPAPDECGGTGDCGQSGACTADGFCWENPLPRVVNGIDLLGFGADEVFVVDLTGAVLRWHGATWQELPGLPANEGLQAIWGAQPDDLWVTTVNDGRVLHWTGASWQSTVVLAGANLRALTGAASNDVYVGGNQGALFHFNGTGWGAVSLPTTVQLQQVIALFARAANDVWALGFGSLDSGATTGQFALHFDGSQWAAVPLTGAPAGFVATDVYVAPTGEAFIAGTANGQRGVVLRRSAGTWSELVIAPSVGPLSSISGTAAGDLWLSTTESVAVHVQGATSSSFSAGVPGLPFHRVRAFGAEVWVGGQQTVSRLEGASFQSMLAGSHESLQAVWVGGPADAWSTGWNGHFSHYDGVSWGERDSVGTLRWFDLAGTPGNLWAVGAQGFVRHFEGVWELSNSNTFSDLHSVSATGPSDAWAVGAAGTVIRWNGSTWSPVSPAPPVSATRTLVGVFAVSPGEAWVVGEAGSVLRFSDGGWLTPALPATVSTYSFNGVWGASSDDVWVVGDHGTTLHWDGGTLAEVSNPLSGSINELVDVVGRSSAEVYAFGRQALRWDGGSWGPVDVGGHFIYGVGASADGGVVVVGSEGATLRHR